MPERWARLDCCAVLAADVGDGSIFVTAGWAITQLFLIAFSVQDSPTARPPPPAVHSYPAIHFLSARSAAPTLHGLTNASLYMTDIRHAGLSQLCAVKQLACPWPQVGARSGCAIDSHLPAAGWSSLFKVLQ